MTKLKINGVEIEVEDGLDVEISGERVSVRRAAPDQLPPAPIHPWPQYGARPFWSIPPWEPLTVTC